MSTVIFALLVFTVVILALSFMLIAARKKLVPQGDVKIIVNGDEENPLMDQPGGTLLGALSDMNVFLPSLIIHVRTPFLVAILQLRKYCETYQIV